MADGREEDGRQVPPWWTDPTKNVESLVQQAMRRQDDLRTAESVHVRELAELRSFWETRLADERAANAQALRMAESARIDAIRAVDVGAVNRAAEVSATQASTLAAQVAVSAETLRTQVAAAATAATTALAAALEPIQKDIADLRRAQYEAQGVKAQTVETRDIRGETRLNINQIITVIMALVAILTLVVLYATKK